MNIVTLAPLSYVQLMDTIRKNPANGAIFTITMRPATRLVK